MDFDGGDDLSTAIDKALGDSPDFLPIPKKILDNAASLQCIPIPSDRPDLKSARAFEVHWKPGTNTEEIIQSLPTFIRHHRTDDLKVVPSATVTPPKLSRSTNHTPGFITQTPAVQPPPGFQPAAPRPSQPWNPDMQPPQPPNAMMLQPDLRRNLARLGSSIREKTIGQRADICTMTTLYDIMIRISEQEDRTLVSIKNAEALMPPRTDEWTHRTLHHGIYGLHIDDWCRKFVGLPQWIAYLKAVVSNPGEVDNVVRMIRCFWVSRIKELDKNPTYPFTITSGTFAGQIPTYVDQIGELAIQTDLQRNVTFLRQRPLSVWLCNTTGFGFVLPCGIGTNLYKSGCKRVDCFFAKAPNTAPVLRPHNPNNGGPTIVLRGADAAAHF
jgi:hypothetical protein